MRILVTGAKGLLGQALRSKLPSDFEHEIKWITREDADLAQSESFRNIVESFSPEVVIHTAAVVGGIGANSRNNLRFYLENTLLDRNVLAVCAAAGVQRLLYFSSNCTYPINADRPLLESSLFTGEVEKTNKGYGEAKLAGVRLCGLINAELGFSYKVLTLANLYGQFDDFEQETSHLIGAVIKKISLAKRSGNSSVEVWGSGKVRRDFIFAEDVASWIWQEIENIEKFPEVMNLGGLDERTIDDFYLLAAKTFDWHIELKHDLDRPDGVSGKLLNSGLAEENFNWRPSTTYEQGFRQIRDWIEQNAI
jgi:GDP-L-fucose synthase